MYRHAGREVRNRQSLLLFTSVTDLIVFPAENFSKDTVDNFEFDSLLSIGFLNAALISLLARWATIPRLPMAPY